MNTLKSPKITNTKKTHFLPLNNLPIFTIKKKSKIIQIGPYAEPRKALVESKEENRTSDIIAESDPLALKTTAVPSVKFCYLYTSIHSLLSNGRPSLYFSKNHGSSKATGIKIGIIITNTNFFRLLVFM